MHQALATQAAIDFPGRNVILNTPSVPDGSWTFGCFEIRDTANPSEVLAVYAAGVDEVCHVDPLTRESMPHC